ncbi:glutamate--tRNA ligase [Halothermothrix orenii]|uniref:Glutamate--tRNA ligase n=1 Tax=Halothermothrix orenii (strain H 168 / OCM 544 / DSM 9562) TaxID=373903 RepID=B8CZA8_HALOH|nr:glutamate--tRNA ligase [Halothermothrix orenii]ACL70627.1 glutamyl-tRNA synthetase [Halothermothrix orenii H 168]
MPDKVRVRFAPSPTGDLHIGGVRTALFNWLFARHNNGDFILRIEDTDAQRSTEESSRQIIKALKWVGLEWDEGPGVGGDYGPYFQSERQQFYQKAIDYLLENDKAYYCYCTPEEIEDMKKEADKRGEPAIYSGKCCNLTEEERKELEKEGRKPVVRLKTPDEGYTVVKDIVRGKVSFENRLLEDLIIMKSDGKPTYNFACVVDDHRMGITHVIRADEHLSNTPKQIMVYKALGYDIPNFAHVPMILAPDRTKLSKRHGATSVDEFMEQGYLPQALINYLLLLGWSPGNNDEIISLDRAIRDFKLDDVSKNPAVYDTKKLTWVNGQYMRSLPLEEIIKHALPLIKEAGFVNFPLNTDEEERLYKIIDAVRERSRTLVELVDGISYFYDDNFEYDEKGVKKHFMKDDTITILENDIDCLKKVEPFNREAIEEIYRARSKDLGVKAARMIHTTRLALSGRTFGPGLFTLVELVGREEAIKRLERALEYVKNKLD